MTIKTIYLLNIVLHPEQTYQRITVLPYYSITVLPVLCKLIDSVIKIGQLDSTQSALQRGFTSGTSPLNAALILEEARRESKDQKKPFILVLLDAKVAFDVVNHGNMMRRLYHSGIQDTHWSLINSLHTNATTSVKWRGDPYLVEQGIRQGGIISTDLYKIYVNPLLSRIQLSGIGIKIGDVECPGSGCADDIGVQADTQEEAQVLTDMAGDFAGKQFYEIQADKSATVVTPHGRGLDSQQCSISLNSQEIPVFQSATHLGLQRSSGYNDTVADTVNQNITKARRTMYSLLSTGLHGENGLDVETSLHLLKIYVLPVLLYGLEIILPPNKYLNELEMFHKKILKQILSVPQNTADPAVYILSGFLPIKEQLHIKVLNFFNNNICYQNDSSIEKRLAYRQTTVKPMHSASWFVEVKTILWIYELGEIEDLLCSPVPKLQWKRTVFNKVSQKYKQNLIDIAVLYKSLKYLNKQDYTPGKIHPVLRIPLVSVTEITRVPVKVKLLTGSYLFQSTRAAFSQNDIRSHLSAVWG